MEENFIQGRQFEGHLNKCQMVPMMFFLLFNTNHNKETYQFQQTLCSPGCSINTFVINYFIIDLVIRCSELSRHC